jgi:hypothetical protein
MKKQQHNVYNLIILDESGSMGSIKSATIRGCNEIVETIKDVEMRFPEQKHFISFVTFNSDGIKEILWNEEVSKLNPINERLYNPACMTPLYDAIGTSVSKLGESLPKDVTYNVLVTILTDGEENSSGTYTREKVKQMIDELKTRSWTFAYIGANHDVEKTAVSLSITNNMQFEANEADLTKMFTKEKNARLNMAEQMSEMNLNEPVAFNTNFYDDPEKDKKGRGKKKK